MSILSIDIGIKNLALCVLKTTHDSNFSISYWEVINLFEDKIHLCDAFLQKSIAKNTFLQKSITKNSGEMDSPKSGDTSNTGVLVSQSDPTVNTFGSNADKMDSPKSGNTSNTGVLKGGPPPLCGKPAKFSKHDHFYCKSHAAKSDFKLPTTELNKYKKLKLDELVKLSADNAIVVEHEKINKTVLLGAIEAFIKDNVLENVSTLKCNDFSLIDIGCAIKTRLDALDFSGVDTVLIEQQISPIANRMNCIQGMVAQYFIMKNITNIQFISASNKLKLFSEKKKTTYTERKKLGIEITQKLLIEPRHDDTPENKERIVAMFNSHKKKDDLADCFLQGIWFIISIRGLP